MNSIVIRSVLAAAVATSLCPAQGPAAAKLPDLLLVSPVTVPAQSAAGVRGQLHLPMDSMQVLYLGATTELPVNPYGTKVHYQFVDFEPSGITLSECFEAAAGQLIGDLRVAAPTNLHAMAQQYADEAGASGEAAWGAPVVSRQARPIYRPDMAVPAYYEFEVAPSGFLVVATAEHDVPVPHWSSEGTGPTARLVRDALAQGRVATRCFKLDTLSYVAEGGAEEIVAQLGNLPARLEQVQDSTVAQHAWTSWTECKQGYVASYGSMLQQLRLQAIGEWAAVLGTTDATWSAWSTSWAGTHEDQCFYYQFDVNGCPSGCGPTAWMMLFGWADYRASVGDAVWAGKQGIYRTNGSVNGSDAVAPRYNDTGIENAIREIRAQVRTFCTPNGGATYPWDMALASAYLAPRTSATIRVEYNAVGSHEDRLREIARYSIAVLRRPVVIGTGWLSHYPLAYGYRSRTKQEWWGTAVERQFYVNQGWGGVDNAWINAGTWFTGELRP